MRAEDALSTIGIPWIQSRALRAIREQGRGSHEVDSLEHAIDTISWGQTEEGGAFWGSVWSWACGSRLLLRPVDPVPDEPTRVGALDALGMIPCGVGDLAVRRAEERGHTNEEPGHHDVTWISRAFIFVATPEGWEFWNAVSKWANGEGPLPTLPSEKDPSRPRHPELGEVEVVHRGETYATVRTSDGSTRFVRSDEMYEG